MNVDYTMPAVFPCNVCNNSEEISIIVTLRKRQLVNIEYHATPATPCIYLSLLTNTNQSSNNRDHFLQRTRISRSQLVVRTLHGFNVMVLLLKK